MNIVSAHWCVDLYAIEDFLGVPTPDQWCHAMSKDEETLLIDHASCEKKAASTALSLLYRYTKFPELLGRISKVAREELRHFEQVVTLMKNRKVVYRSLSARGYASGLHGLVRHYEPAKLIDSLIVAAFIEARSCERFGLLRNIVSPDIGTLYSRLFDAESRHFCLYLELAHNFADEKEILERCQVFREREAHLITGCDPILRFHSGMPC